MREIHPGSPQEWQQRFLQAQEQSPAGGVGALNGVVQLPHSVSSAFSWVGGDAKTPKHTHTVTSHLENHHPNAHHEPTDECAII